MTSLESCRILGVRERNVALVIIGVAKPAPIFLHELNVDMARGVRNRVGNDKASPTRNPCSQSCFTPKNSPMIEDIGSIIDSGRRATNSIPINLLKSKTLSWFDNRLALTIAPTIVGITRTPNENSRV